ncbi:helix-turn-helix domain-containing protein [Mesorhizobium sp. 43Arga]
MAKLFQTAPGQGLAYRAYIRTVRKRNNVTLRTLEQMAKALDLSIAIMLSGDAHIEPWAYVLSAKSICTRLANIIDSERECPNLPRHGMAAPVGVSEVTYSKLERATGNISVDTIAGVAKALDLDPPTFFFIEREPA